MKAKTPKQKNKAAHELGRLSGAKRKGDSETMRALRKLRKNYPKRKKPEHE